MVAHSFPCSIWVDVFIAQPRDTCKTVQKYQLCNENHSGGPTLRVNNFIAQMATYVKKMIQENSRVESDGAGDGNGLCAILTGVKSTAVKSCLGRIMSYCETHLEPHQKMLALKRHRLAEPVRWEPGKQDVQEAWRAFGALSLGGSNSHMQVL